MTILFKMLFAFFMCCWHIFSHVAKVTLLLNCVLALFDTIKSKIVHENNFELKYYIVQYCYDLRKLRFEYQFGIQ